MSRCLARASLGYPRLDGARPGLNMDCPTCGHPNPSDARFCGSCATPLTGASPCPSCGASNPAGQKFCNACGAGADCGSGGGRPGDRRTRRSARPRRSHVPEHLAEKIRAGRGALEGERKQVTVLFADVMGSMELAERSDPEEWRRIMERFFAILCAGRPPVRGHRRQVHRRRHHGPVRRPDRPRGPRPARLLRGASPPGGARLLRGGAPPRAGAQLLGAHGPQLRRGGGGRDRRGPGHGLHRDRPHGGPGAAHGAARRARQGLPHPAHGVARGGLPRAHRPGRVPGQGRQPAAARPRADRRRRRPRAAGRLTRARLLAGSSAATTSCGCSRAPWSRPSPASRR